MSDYRFLRPLANGTGFPTGIIETKSGETIKDGDNILNIMNFLAVTSERDKRLYEAEKARREAGEDVIMRYVPVSAVDTKSYSDWKNAIAAHEAVVKEIDAATLAAREGE